MSGLIITQDNTNIEIDLNDGNGFVELPCATTVDRGTTQVNRVVTTCLSSPPGTAEYSNGSVTYGEGSLVYNADLAAAVHQHFLQNEGSALPIQLRATVTDNSVTPARSMVATTSFLIGGVSDPIAFDSIYTHTIGIQRTGETVFAFA